MSWYFEGNGIGLHIGLSELGKNSVWGIASSHKPRPIGDCDITLIERLENSSFDWSIFPNNELPEFVDELWPGLNDYIELDLDRPIASIAFHADPDSVGVGIALPPSMYARVEKLFRDILIHEKLRYIVTLDFSGFRKPEVEYSTPSAEEFLSGPRAGKSYLSKEVSIVVNRREDDA